jgi:hypothetical protein
MTGQNLGLGLCRDCDPDVVDAPTKAFRMRTALQAGEGTVLTGSANCPMRLK